MGGYEPSFSHPLYEQAERRHTEGAAGVQEAVACRCLITAETARSAAGQYPAGSGVLPASSTTRTPTENLLSEPPLFAPSPLQCSPYVI